MFASCCRSPGGSYLGDVNISAILDSFSVSYDKRVRPNYGGECLFDVHQLISHFGREPERPPELWSRGSGPVVGPRRKGGADRWSGGLPSDAQHLSRPPFRSQPPTGRWRVGRARGSRIGLALPRAIRTATTTCDVVTFQVRPWRWGSPCTC